MRTKFNLEVYGMADDTAYVKIVEIEDKAPFILFSTNLVEQPDFVLHGEDLEEFAVNILNIIKSKKLATELL